MWGQINYPLITLVLTAAGVLVAIIVGWRQRPDVCKLRLRLAVVGGYAYPPSLIEAAKASGWSEFNVVNADRYKSSKFTELTIKNTSMILARNIVINVSEADEIYVLGGTSSRSGTLKIGDIRPGEEIQIFIWIKYEIN